MLKILGKLGIKFLQHEEGHLPKNQQLTLKTECFPPRSRTRQERLLLSHTDHCNRGPRQCNKARK